MKQRDLVGYLAGSIRPGGRERRGMRPRWAHLEVDEREGEGLERVVVAEEGAQPRSESERRRARAAGHPDPPASPRRRRRRGRRSVAGSRGDQGGRASSGERSRREIFAADSRRATGAEENLLPSGGWQFRPSSLFCVDESKCPVRKGEMTGGDESRLGSPGVNSLEKNVKLFFHIYLSIYI